MGVALYKDNVQKPLIGFSVQLSHGFGPDSAALSVTEKDVYEHYYSPVTQVDEELRFKQLADNWISETLVMSSISEIVSNHNYLSIIAMGKSALPFILRHLQREPNHWFEALKAITGSNPIRVEDRGNIKAMVDSWIAWGRSRGYI